MNLKPLDVIILEGRLWSPFEVPVMWRSMSKFSHSVIANPLDCRTVFNPNIGGILNTDIREYKGRSGAVCRYNKEINLVRVTEWLLNVVRVSEGYDYKAWLGFATGFRALTDENRWFCSELAYWMFQDNGCILTREELIFPFPSFFYYHEDFDVVYEGKL